MPSIFLRTFGCNFRCRGFNRAPATVPHDEKYNPEVVAIIQDRAKYSDYNSLPLVHTGCDSYAAVYPEFRDYSPLTTVDDLVPRILGLLPDRAWSGQHLVITGGEPLLGWQRSYPALLSHPSMSALNDITFETNGTQELSAEFQEFLRTWNQQRFPHINADAGVTFSVSPKLSASGEIWTEAIKPQIIAQYQTLGYVYLKFVIGSRLDADEAMRAVTEYRAAGFLGPVYFMPVGGVNSVYDSNTRAVADLALEYGVRYSARLQCDLFGNEWGT